MCVFFLKINRIENSHSPVDTYKRALHEEICQLRKESRNLREISHQLNEENHRLKEQLWDIKRQCEWLKHTVADKQDGKRICCVTVYHLSSQSFLLSNCNKYVVLAKISHQTTGPHSYCQAVTP